VNNEKKTKKLIVIHVSGGGGFEGQLFKKQKKKIFLSFVAASVCFEIHRRDSGRGGRMMAVGI
jgi:hypothetical protein